MNTKHHIYYSNLHVAGIPVLHVPNTWRYASTFCDTCLCTKRDHASQISRNE